MKAAKSWTPTSYKALAVDAVIVASVLALGIFGAKYFIQQAVGPIKAPNMSKEVAVVPIKATMSDMFFEWNAITCGFTTFGALFAARRVFWPFSLRMREFPVIQRPSGIYFNLREACEREGAPRMDYECEAAARMWRDAQVLVKDRLKAFASSRLIQAPPAVTPESPYCRIQIQDPFVAYRRDEEEVAFFRTIQENHFLAYSDPKQVESDRGDFRDLLNTERASRMIVYQLIRCETAPTEFNVPLSLRFPGFINSLRDLRDQFRKLFPCHQKQLDLLSDQEPKGVDLLNHLWKDGRKLAGGMATLRGTDATRLWKPFSTAAATV